MNKNLLLLVIISILQSCSPSNDSIEDLVVVNEKGVQENKGDTLSVEDVLKLEKATQGLSYSYSSVLTSSMEKSYPFTSDSGQNILCVLTSDENRASVSLYKETIITAKIDSVKKMKIKNFSKIGEGDSISDVSKKPTNYKALVRVHSKLGGDSTVKFVLNIFKN